jgi:hypothetical protein
MSLFRAFLLSRCFFFREISCQGSSVVCVTNPPRQKHDDLHQQCQRLIENKFLFAQTLLLSFVMQIIWLSFCLGFIISRCRNVHNAWIFMHKTRHFLMRATFFSEKQADFLMQPREKKAKSFQRTFATQCVLKLTSRSCRGGSEKHIK